MKGRIRALLFFLALAVEGSQAFCPFPSKQPSRSSNKNIQSLVTTSGKQWLQATPEEDCGCGQTEYTGKPSSSAQTIRHLEVISNLPIYTIDGAETTISQTLQTQTGGKTPETSLVVFLRSLGWPFCQEQIVQYNKRREELLANNVSLVLVSIGVPEKAKALMDHLNVSCGEEWFLVDPENLLYNALELNKGVASTFGSIDTPFAFRDRIFGVGGRKDGMGDLIDVLGKWKDAIYIPPKQEQAFQQGGAFLFQGEETFFAHYDGGAGAHVEVGKVVEKAISVAKS